MKRTILYLLIGGFMIFNSGCGGSGSSSTDTFTIGGTMENNLESVITAIQQVLELSDPLVLETEDVQHYNEDLGADLVSHFVTATANKLIYQRLINGKILDCSYEALDTNNNPVNLGTFDLENLEKDIKVVSEISYNNNAKIKLTRSRIYKTDLTVIPTYNGSYSYADYYPCTITFTGTGYQDLGSETDYTVINGKIILEFTDKWKAEININGPVYGSTQITNDPDEIGNSDKATITGKIYQNNNLLTDFIVEYLNDWNIQTPMPISNTFIIQKIKSGPLSSTTFEYNRTNAY
ncbi:MAG: hypothetical protein M0P94_03255 [Candidatus Absconditabacterales bacterium]|nr:hypothetical protein [Candidatus Absconditabacterales bacterium]